MREEWDKKTENEQVMLKSLLGNKAEPPAFKFSDKVEELADFCEQSEGFNIY